MEPKISVSFNYNDFFLTVIVAPNNVGLTALPMDGVRESKRLDLTCVTSSCHPPAVIRWFEVPNHGTLEEDEGGWTVGTDPTKPNELTDLAQMDTVSYYFWSNLLNIENRFFLHVLDTNCHFLLEVTKNFFIRIISKRMFRRDILAYIHL